MTFTKKDEAVLIGLILGDGYLSKDNKLKIVHSEKQKEYCIYKAKLMHSVFGGNPIIVHDSFQKYTTWINKERVSKTAKVVWIQKGSKALEGWRNRIYINSNKVYTRDLLNKMDETSLLLWWLDDGNLDCHKSGSGSICWALRWNIFTTKEEIKTIQQYFKEVWNINWNIRQLDKRSPNKWSLCCGKIEGEKFLSLFRDKVLKCIPSMAYKVLFSDTRAKHLVESEDIV